MGHFALDFEMHALVLKIEMPSFKWRASSIVCDQSHPLRDKIQNREKTVTLEDKKYSRVTVERRRMPQLQSSIDMNVNFSLEKDNKLHSLTLLLPKVVSSFEQ